MNILYKKPLLTLMIAAAASGAAFGQKTKVRTITIVNGDTTVNERITDDDVAQMEKEMNIVINDDDSTSGKKTVKKIVIRGDGDDADAKAFAYSFGDMDEPDIDMTTGADGSMNIVIKKSRTDKADLKDNKDSKDSKDTKEKKVIIKNSSSTVMSSGTSGKTEKEKLNVNIRVEDTTAKISISSGSSAPMNVSVLDENGRQVFYDSQQNGGSYQKEIPLGKKGTFFLNLIQDKRSTTEKIVVE